MLVEQIVQSVAGYLTREPTQLGINELRMGIDKLMQLLIDVFVAYSAAIKSNLFPAGQHDGDRYEIFCRGSISNRMRTTSIIGHHAAYGAARMRRGIRTISQSVLSNRSAQRIAHHSRFDGSRAVFNIDIKNSVEIP